MIGIIMCFWGVFIVSVFVVTLTSMLAFDKIEEKTYNILYRLKLKQELKERSVYVLAAAYR